MSLAIAHFAVGAAMTTLLVTYLLPAVRYPRTLPLAGGAWAVLPDLHWVSPVFQQQLRTFHHTSVLTDLFWFHRILDRLDPSDSKMIATVLLAVLILISAVVEHRDHRIASPDESFSNDESTK